MAVFPRYNDIPFMNPLIISYQFKTLISNFNDLGEEKRRKKWIYPKRTITLSYMHLSRANAKTVWDFYMARQGSYQAFTFFLSYTDTYTGEYVGTGDGSTVLFNVPSENGSSYTVYLDGVSQSGGGVDYTFTAVGGTDGCDKITFVAAPGSGVRITYDFSGILRIRCRFVEDYQEFEQMYDKFISTGINLQGLLNS